jgi:hypothetical protein
MLARLSGVVLGLGAVLAIGSASGEAAYCLDFRNDTTLRIPSYNNVGEFVRYEQPAVPVVAPTSSLSAIETLTPPAADLSLPPHGSSLTYLIIEKREEHVLSGVRVVMKVQLSREASEPELRSIGEEMIRQESTRRRLNAIALLYYLPDAGAADVCPLGRAVWAPKGNWDATHTVRLGDYSSHQHVVAAGSLPHRWKGRSTSVAPSGDVMMRTPPDRAADGGR